MTCAETEPLIGASLDCELDPQTSLAMETHLASCPRCSGLLARLERLREEIAAAGLDWSADVDLRPLRASIRRGAGMEPWYRRGWMWQSLAVAMAAALLVLVALPRSSGVAVERMMLDNHLRSLEAGHLVDVPSSDRHTVKPWFQGKLAFAPNVPDLSARGFVLTGGRLDVIGGKQAAALVYQRGQHIINLWVYPDEGADRSVQSSTVEGFHLLRWRKGRMAFWAISDVNEAELRQFAELIRAG
jgi:anti-sigma factor RsiW